MLGIAFAIVILCIPFGRSEFIIAALHLRVLKGVENIKTRL